MAELADMLKNILDDPSTVDKLKGMLGGGVSAAPAPAADIDPDTLMKITRAMKAMNSGDSDGRTRLLRDLKPYISGRRARRLDDAINILKMLTVIEVMKNESEESQ